MSKNIPPYPDRIRGQRNKSTWPSVWDTAGALLFALSFVVLYTPSSQVFSKNTYDLAFQSSPSCLPNMSRIAKRIANDKLHRVTELRWIGPSFSFFQTQRRVSWQLSTTVLHCTVQYVRISYLSLLFSPLRRSLTTQKSMCIPVIASSSAPVPMRSTMAIVVI
jgi:hypothetical protein